MHSSTLFESAHVSLWKLANTLRLSGTAHANTNVRHNVGQLNENGFAFLASGFPPQNTRTLACSSCSTELNRGLSHSGRMHPFVQSSEISEGCFALYHLLNGTTIQRHDRMCMQDCSRSGHCNRYTVQLQTNRTEQKNKKQKTKRYKMLSEECFPFFYLL